MAIPSQSNSYSGLAGVETVWQAPAHERVEETVQTPNLKKATKVVVVRITDWSLVQVQPPPPCWNSFNTTNDANGSFKV